MNYVVILLCGFVFGYVVGRICGYKEAETFWYPTVKEWQKMAWDLLEDIKKIKKEK